MFTDSEQRPGRVPVRTAAARLGIPRGWVLRLCQEGRFPARAVRVGNDWHIEEEGVERLRRRLHREGSHGGWSVPGRAAASHGRGRQSVTGSIQGRATGPCRDHRDCRSGW